MSDSLNDGGFHGFFSIVGREDLYYAVGVTPEPGGRTVNGFRLRAAWKNVVATLYHELNEHARTGRAAVIARSVDPARWTSRNARSGMIFGLRSQPLSLVFRKFH